MVGWFVNWPPSSSRDEDGAAAAIESKWIKLNKNSYVKIVIHLTYQLMDNYEIKKGVLAYFIERL